MGSTSHGELYLPKWFDVFLVSYNQEEAPIEGFIIDVMECGTDTDVHIGSQTVNLTDSSVHTQWIQLDMTPEFRDVEAKVEVRFLRLKDRYLHWLEDHMELPAEVYLQAAGPRVASSDH
jgi:hypothetical protein